MSAIIELEAGYENVRNDPAFGREIAALQSEYAGRKTP